MLPSPVRALLARRRSPRPTVWITTIEGPRSVTKGSAPIAAYGEKRRSLVSKSTKVGKSRYA